MKLIIWELNLSKKRKKRKIVMEGEEDLNEKRKFRREIEVEKNTVTKVSDFMTRIMGKVDGWENVEDHWKCDTEYIGDSEMSDVLKL